MSWLTTIMRRTGDAQITKSTVFVNGESLVRFAFGIMDIGFFPERRHVPMPNKKTFAHTIYYARKERDLTQQEAAEKLDISVRWLQKMEKSGQLPGSALLIRMAQFYDMDVRELNEEPAVYRYTISCHQHYRPEMGLFHTCSLHICRKKGVGWQELEMIPDISNDRERAIDFAERCTLEQAEPCHIRELLEDWFGTHSAKDVSDASAVHMKA